MKIFTSRFRGNAAAPPPSPAPLALTAGTAVQEVPFQCSITLVTLSSPGVLGLVSAG